MFSGLAAQVNTGLMIATSKLDPKVTPKNDAPFLQPLRDLVGNVVTACLILAVLALLVGVVAFIFGRVSGSSRAQEVTLTVAVWVLIGAMIIGCASAAVAWAAGWNLFPGGK